MKRAWDDEFVIELLKSDNYREFIKLFFSVSEFQRNHPKPMSFQKFSNIAGYASKSYPADIIAGRKKLTLESVAKFSKGLSLNQAYTEFLKNLIKISNETDDVSRDILRSKNSKIKEKLLNDLQSKISKSSKSYSKFEKILLQENFPEIFAALGSVERGANIQDIMKRTNIKAESIKPILLQLEAESVLVQKQERFYLVQSAFDFEISNIKEYFKHDFYRSIEKAKKRFIDQVESDSSLFATQTFSVNSDRLPELKALLLQTVVEFSSQYEHPEGDKVAEIVIGLSHC